MITERPDVARVLARYRPAGDPAVDGSIAVIVAPGIDGDAVRRAVGFSADGRPGVAGTVVVLLDPMLPVGREMADRLRGLSPQTTVIVVDDGCADTVRTDVLSRVAHVHRVTVTTTDALPAAVRAESAPVADEPGADDAAPLRAARTALLAAARADTAAAEVEALRERRRRVAADRREAGTSDPRRAAAHTRVELAHRIGELRRALTGQVLEVIDDAPRMRRRAGGAGGAAVVTTLVETASDALARDTAAAVARLLGGPAPTSVPVVGRTDVARPRPDVRWSADDGVAVVLALSAGAGAGRASTWALGVGGVGAVVLGATVAAVLTAVVTLSRRRSGRVRTERRWALDVVADTAAAWERDVAVAVMTAEAEAADRAAAAAREDAARRESELAGIDTEIRRVGARAAARAAAYERDLAVLDGALAEIAGARAGR